MRVSIYTDGAARGNPDGPGGYGTVLSMWIPKGSFIQKNFHKDIRRRRIIEWN